MHIKQRVSLAILMFASSASALAQNAGVWTGPVKVPVNVTVPFRMELKQTGHVIAGTVQVGSAVFAIIDGKADKDGVTFSTVHDVRIIDATHNEKLDQPVTFNYKATIAGDTCHLIISHADGTGQPGAFDFTRSKE